jgi:hypothetical protein
MAVSVSNEIEFTSASSTDAARISNTVANHDLYQVSEQPEDQRR